MRLLIAGASGFIGRNYLLASDPEWAIDAIYRTATDFPAFVVGNGLRHVTAHQCDLSVEEQVRTLAIRLPRRFDTILYLAANADPAASTVFPVDDLMGGPIALVRLLSTFQCDRLVYFSSGAVYERLRGPVDPQRHLMPHLPYAISKLTCERYVDWFHHKGTIGRHVILRFFGAYGPYEPRRKIYTKVVRWAMEGAREPFRIRGDGQNLIDAMYVTDVVRGVKAVIASEALNEVVDFAAGAPLTINALIDRAILTFGICDAKIEHFGTVAEYHDFFASGQKMLEIFGFAAEVPLEQGLLRLKDHLAATDCGR